MIVGLAPGVVLGTSLVHHLQPAWLKLATFSVLLPLILLQAGGFRRPIRDERRVGLLFGGGLGVLYSVTTISGPPLAVMLSNQGLAKQDFRAGLGLVRLAESTFTAAAYYFAGMVSIESAGLLPYILPSLVVGIPLGVRVIQRVRRETFRRVCMSFDAWVVGFGIPTLLRQLHVIESNAAFSVLAAVGLLDTWLLYRFFRQQTATAETHARRSSTIPMSVNPASAEPSAGNGRLTAAASTSSPIPARTAPVLNDAPARISRGTPRLARP